MKKKRVTYILLILTVLLWGVILYRIVVYTKNDSPVMSQIPSGKPSNIKEEREFTLMLNYRDPFSVEKKESDKPRIEKINNNRQHIPVPDPPVFKFKGLIRNGKEKYGLFEWDESIEAISQKKKVEDFKIVLLNCDSVVLEKYGHKYVLKNN